MYLLQRALRFLSPVGRILRLLFSSIAFRFRNQDGLPLVTVIVPLYNEERFLLACLTSIRRQRYRNLECMIVNDGSTDRSREIAVAFCKKDDRFRVVDQPENRGLSSSRNLGVEHARGKYVQFLDADDYLYPDAIWRRVLLLEKRNDEGVAGAHCRIIQRQEDDSPRAPFGSSFLPAPGIDSDFIACRGDCPFNVHAALVRTEVVRRLGGFDESMKHGAEDWDLWQRIMRHGYTFLTADVCGGGYRQKRNSMIRTSPARHVGEAIRLIDEAYADIRPDAVVEGTSFVFTRGVGYYTKTIVKAQRLIGFATMAWLRGDHEEFVWILDQFEPGSAYYLARTLDIPWAIDEAIMRYHCIEWPEYKGRLAEFNEQRMAVRNAIRQRIGPDAEPEETTP
jgi:hypothetical protein